MDVEESIEKQVIDENIDKFNEKCKERRLCGQTVIRQRQHEKIRIQRNTVNTTKVQHNFETKKSTRQSGKRWCVNKWIVILVKRQYAYHTNSTNAKKPLISTGFFFRVPVPRGLTLNEQDINYKHTAQHTDKHTENTKTNEIWKKTTTIFIQMDTNTMTSTRKIQKHMD